MKKLFINYVSNGSNKAKVSVEENPKSEQNVKMAKWQNGNQGAEKEEREANVLKLAVRNVVGHVTIYMALNCIQEIEGLKQKQSCLEERNKELETSLEFAHSSITELNKKADAQDKALNQTAEVANQASKRRKTTIS